MPLYADLPAHQKPDSIRLSRRALRDLKIQDLCNSGRKSLLVMRRYRENYKRIVRLIAAAEWSDNAADMRRPWNGLALYQQIVSKYLINQNPRALLSTWRTEYQREVWTAQEWGNKQFPKMNLGAHIRRAVNDALAWMGIIKVGITTPIDSERMGFKLWAGEAFAMSVSPDDYVADVFAKSFEDMRYEGHRYQGGVEVANRFFELYGEKKLQSGGQRQFNLEGDERLEMIGRGYMGGGADEFNESTDLYEIHVRSHNMVLTFRSKDGGAPAGPDDLIEAHEYIGPYCGQYTKFGYLDVPGNLFPKGPEMDLLPLDQSINIQMRKTLRQAENLKQQTWFTSQAAEDMQNINNHDDGDSVRVSRMNEIQQRTLNEPNPRLLMVMAQMMQVFNKIAGNLDTLGGLAKMAGTAAQEQQLNANATASIASLQQTTVGCVSEVMNNIFWYWWHDPLGTMHATYRGIKSNPDLTSERFVSAEQRQGIDWSDIEAMVDPYSLASQTPQQKLQHIRSLIQTAIPMLPFLAQQNVLPDAMFWIQKEGEYMNNPDAPRLFRLQEAVPGTAPGSSHEGGTKSPASQRTYNYKSDSEATDEGMQDDLIQKLMGAGMSPMNTERNGEMGA